MGCSFSLSTTHSKYLKMICVRMQLGIHRALGRAAPGPVRSSLRTISRSVQPLLYLFDKYGYVSDQPFPRVYHKSQSCFYTSYGHFERRFGTVPLLEKCNVLISTNIFHCSA